MKTPILQTERLILRPVTLEDASALQKYFDNWNIIQHLNTGVPWPYPKDGSETFLKETLLPQVEKEEILAWVITIRAHGDEAIGRIDFGQKRRGETGDRGFWLAEQFHGRGYMTEAITAVQDFLFFEAGLEKITVMNALSNAGSRRVKEKTGAVFIGTKDFAHNSGDTVSEVWEVTRENWVKIRGRSE